MKTFRIAIIGCGNISAGYAETLKGHAHLKLLGAADLDPKRAADFCAKFGGRVYGSLDEILADPAVDAVVNLTIHHAHAEVVRRCLEAGKHVHTEKPLALTYGEASALVELAKEKNLVLSSSPITFLGEAQQTAWKYIRDGKIGDVRLVFAEVNWGRIESWHPNPVPFYEVGVVFDVGIYPLTLLTAFLGPIRRVQATGRILKKERVTQGGEAFALDYPDYVCANLEFASGAMARLTSDFYVAGNNSKQTGVEFHGDAGSLVLGHWFMFDSTVEAAAFGEPLQPVPLVRPGYKGGAEWARCIVEMAEAIAEGRRPRATGEHAAHVIEVICAINSSMKEERPVEVRSDFPPPEPMDWAR